MTITFGIFKCIQKTHTTKADKDGDPKHTYKLKFEDVYLNSMTCEVDLVDYDHYKIGTALDWDQVKVQSQLP